MSSKRADEKVSGKYDNSESFETNYFSSFDIESNNKYEHSKEYVKGKDFFTVTKKACNEGINFNTEYKDCKITQVNGIDYIEYGETRHGYGIIWKKTDINTRFPAIFQVRF